jgi:serralysin
VDRVSYDFASTGVSASLANPGGNKGDAAGDSYVAIENLSGSDFNDKLGGNAGKNAINGGAGDDIIRGFEGKDTLTGATGKDVFVFNTALSAATNVDTITDFSFADDTIQLDNAVFAALTTTGVLAPAAFRVNASGLAEAGSDRVIYDANSGKLFYDADGVGGASGIQFAQLGIGLGLTNQDFVVI